MIYLVLFYLLLYFFLAWRRLDWAVLIIIAALPFYLIRFKIFGLPFTLLEAMILISFGVWFIANFNELKANLTNLFKRQAGKGRMAYPFRYEIILMLVISYLAAAFSGFSASALGIWKAYFFEPALFFIVVLNVFKKKDDLKKILWPLAFSALAVSTVAIYQKITGNLIFNEFWAAEETRRATSFFGYPNSVGLYLGPVVLVLVGWLAEKIKNFSAKSGSPSAVPGHWRAGASGGQILIIILTIIFSIMATYFAKSEGALIAVVAGLMAFGLMAGGKIRWATAVLIIVGVLGIVSYAPAREYLFNKVALRDLSGQIRREQWAETWKMMKDGRLIFGAGLANYQKAIRPYHQEGIFVRDYKDPNWHRKTVFNEEYREKVWQPLEIYLYPHNIFLNFWSELGLLGMLLFVWIIGKFFYMGLKIIENCKLPPPWRGPAVAGKIVNLEVLKSKYIVLGLMGAMAVIMVHGLVDVPYFKNDLAVIFWIMVAMLGIIDLEIKKVGKKQV
jgi:O-antigen ligase